MIETLVDKVRSFGGRVEELSAAGFVALFGLDPVEDPVRRAALAALAMQRAAQRSPDAAPGPTSGSPSTWDRSSWDVSRTPPSSTRMTSARCLARRASW